MAGSLRYGALNGARVSRNTIHRRLHQLSAEPYTQVAAVSANKTLATSASALIRVRVLRPTSGDRPACRCNRKPDTSRPTLQQNGRCLNCLFITLPQIHRDGILFSIDFFVYLFVCLFLCFFVSKITRKRLDRFA